MEKPKNVEEYYATPHSFKIAITKLRAVALQTEAVETCKWGMPVYTINDKNVFGICRFKKHYGIWFYNGALMDDPKGVLQNAQEGKTRGMRHWKFTSEEEIDTVGIRNYLENAIQKQKDGKVLSPKKKPKLFSIPPLLKNALEENDGLKTAYSILSPYKQKEFALYISEAKQDNTKTKRLKKVLPMILKGVGLNDKYK